MATVTSYIHQHYRDPDLTVTKLAQYAYVSREHLSRVFKEYTKQSIHDYLTELRMQGCRQDIADGKRILAACTENGFRTTAASSRPSTSCTASRRWSTARRSRRRGKLKTGPPCKNKEARFTVNRSRLSGQHKKRGLQE